MTFSTYAPLSLSTHEHNQWHWEGILCDTGSPDSNNKFPFKKSSDYNLLECDMLGPKIWLLKLQCAEALPRGLFWNCWLLGICRKCRRSCPIESWIYNSVQILDLELTHQCRWVATLESACNMKNKRAESKTKRRANNWETTRGRGPPRERSNGQRRPQRRKS